MTHVQKACMYVRKQVFIFIRPHDFNKLIAFVFE